MQWQWRGGHQIDKIHRESVLRCFVLKWKSIRALARSAGTVRGFGGVTTRSWPCVRGVCATILAHASMALANCDRRTMDNKEYVQRPAMHFPGMDTKQRAIRDRIGTVPAAQFTPGPRA
jgi:hypothetical protein